MAGKTNRRRHSISRVSKQVKKGTKLHEKGQKTRFSYQGPPTNMLINSTIPSA